MTGIELSMLLLNDGIKGEVAINMKTHGGSFVKGLGEALLHADPVNTGKICMLFTEYINNYLPEKWSTK